MSNFKAKAKAVLRNRLLYSESNVAMFLSKNVTK